jgi:ribonuclease BN (tRNA processing enzyme)
VCELWGNHALVENAFELKEYDPTATIAIGSMSVSFSEVPHFVDTFAVSVQAGNGGGRLAYGADSRPAEELVEFARDADLFLVEATLPRPERTGIRGHLTSEEAGQHAKQAGARRVLLTHISDELDQDKARELASAAFGGPVDVAVEGAVYEI